ncbi:hypothetical protein K461DRAFT_164733 [Myriangium duriaei CBS 260.36]|uniref:Secreted protein n=1 Tax=Myriangium duriaei CBS 260.36 TaxID=1168546 RepID=A0A9P4MEB8_9PEZI|nr:hypothetical protein K461DRAFT_164733 [Myriangium duriaei CBS 260.36]
MFTVTSRLLFLASCGELQLAVRALALNHGSRHYRHWRRSPLHDALQVCILECSAAQFDFITALGIGKSQR